MLQLAHYLRNGKMELMEVPFPSLQHGRILVRNHYSLISTGTESRTVKDARAGLFAKAMARKEDVKKVIDTARKQGIIQARKLLSDRLDVPLPLGYSCFGEVIETDKNVKGINPGDMVACAGENASHAEVVSVPHLLCAKVPAGIPGKQAAFTTVGAIAMQAFRQSQLSIGSSCVVIGLGLIGQLIVQICAAAGVQCMGIDLTADKLQTALKNGAVKTFLNSHPGLEKHISNFTNGNGADAIFISASTDSLEPINQAGRYCRKRGNIVIVGKVPTGFDRKNFYRKELNVKMSTSYGPGRYDPEYEEHQRDYPPDLVRWTAQRNMQSFVALLSEGKLHPERLISKTIPFKEAPAAYDLIIQHPADITAVLLEYEQPAKLMRQISLRQNVKAEGKIIAGFIGAGKFARSYLLPHLKGKIELKQLATATPLSSKSTAERFGFRKCTDNALELIHDASINCVFITTRHHLHAQYVIESLQAGKHVFVEKPLCLNERELHDISRIASSSDRLLMLGFNRRYAPFTEKALTFLPDEARVIHIRVNAGHLSPDHWMNDPEIGGGRILGEACHFIDLAAHLAQSKINRVTAHMVPDAMRAENTASILLGFENGSAASINYCSNGNRQLPKEYIEVHSGGISVVINDFKELRLYGKKRHRIRSSGQDKGHQAEMTAFLRAVEKGAGTGQSFEQIKRNTLATFKVIESASRHRLIRLDEE